MRHESPWHGQETEKQRRKPFLAGRFILDQLGAFTK
jgi:hypothetical protein